MARSKRVDETGLPNDNRSIQIEKSGILDLEGTGLFEPDWDYTSRTWDDPGDDINSYSSHPQGLTNRIEIPEHLRKIGS